MSMKCIISSRAECQFQICGDLEFGKLLFLCIFVGLNLTSEKEQRVMTGLVHTKKDDAIKRRERGSTGWSGEWPMTAGLVLFQTRNEGNDLTLDPDRSSVSVN